MATSYPTPLYSHAGRGEFSEVYEPAEDSFLLIDALEKDAEMLQLKRGWQWIRSGVCISGISGWTLSPVHVSKSDMKSSQCTAMTASCNGVSLQPVLTDLVGSKGIEAAWAGGKRGREVTDRFLPLVAQLLSKKGLFYLVTIAENNPEEIIRLLQECGLRGESCLSTRAGNERLCILRFSWSQQT
uniref:N-6 adenine-specific DNA methyltransferase 1 n=1 Tax=Sphaeramia orbicularis TaxID=375764 RepID=A0A673BJ71_9TELE